MRISDWSSDVCSSDLIVETGVEQYVRDARISMIYEGANGVHAMDLVGRKLAMNGGRAIQLLFKTVEEEVAHEKQNQKLTKFAEALERHKGELGMESCRDRWFQDW